ncbi:MAG: hypothetical protein J0H83_07905 [Candidatus Melainabacteria bacterium]|jgi:hypothetical protein|nr:hypothetical protein [Candidatus Melainabacteria bacterium]MBX9672524.1 hypothetical protein [Candidatus Obscuribacterales bacterium]
MHNDSDMDLYKDLLWIDYWSRALWAELPILDLDVATTGDTAAISQIFVVGENV